MLPPASSGTKPRAGRSYGVVLGTALVVGYVLVRGALLLRSVPPWQGPDEPGHAEYAMTLAAGFRGRDWATDIEADILASMDRNGFYGYLGIARPSEQPRVFADVQRLGGDPTQMDSETPIGYLPYALALAVGARQADVESALVRLRSVSLLLVVGVVLAAAWAASAVLGPSSAAPAAAVVAAAPMLGFAGAVTNNDLPAALLATLWFGVLAHLARNRDESPAAVNAVLLLVLAVLAAAAKRTGLFLVPVTVLALALLSAARRRERPPRPGRPGATLGRRRALVACALGLVVLGWMPVQSRAAAWQRVGDPWGPERVAGGRFGSHALAIVDRSNSAWQYMEQSGPAPGSAQVEARAWARAQTPTSVSLVVSDDTGTWLSRTAVVAQEWTLLQLEGALASDATGVRLAVYAGDSTAGGTGSILIDDVRLLLDGRSALRNGNAEDPVRVGPVILDAALRYSDVGRLARAVPGAVTSPRKTAARAWLGTFFLYRSFWGGFGWLTIWPGPRYDLVAGPFTGLAVAAVMVVLLWPRALSTKWPSIFVLRVLAVCGLAAVVASLVGSMAGWGDDSLPQGRYLLPVVAALAIIVTGLADRIWPRFGPWLLAACAVTIDVSLLVGVVLPAYR